MDGWIRFPFIEVTQPIGTFYVGVIPARELVGICEADVRRLSERARKGIARGDVFAEYMGIQRHLNPYRVREIRSYVQTIDASFPNTIILAVSSDDVRIEDSYIHVRKEPGVATIIDGQHRLAGFYDGGASSQFDLIVTIFLDMEREGQAYLFSTINTKQTRINPSLAKDLLEFSSIETPEKVSHNITKAFNTEKGGPWFRKIKMLGNKDELASGVITQHSFTKQIIDLIYDDAVHNEVRSALKEHRGKRQMLSRVVAVDISKYPFWELYVGHHDDAIYKILRNYFQAFMEVYPRKWGNPEYILSKTTGYRALMLELRRIVSRGIEDGSLSFEYFRSVAEMTKENLTESETDLISTYYAVGEAEAKKLQRVMFRNLGEVC